MVTGDLNRLIAQLEADSSLLEPDQLRKRIEILDELDACFGHSDSTAVAETELVERARAIQTRLEAADSAIYHAIRSEVQRRSGVLQQGARPETLLRWIEICSDRNEMPPRGLGYDCLDELISGVLQLREPGGALVRLGPRGVLPAHAGAPHSSFD